MYYTNTQSLETLYFTTVWDTSCLTQTFNNISKKLVVLLKMNGQFRERTGGLLNLRAHKWQSIFWQRK